MPRRLILLVCCLSVAGCGASAQEDAGLPRVRGTVGQSPRVEVGSSVPGSRVRIKVLSEGTGPVTRAGQVVITNVEIVDWQRDRPLLGTYDTEQPTTITLDGKHVASTWARALVGRHAGSRVLLVAPATEAFGPDGRAPAGVAPSDTLVDVFDIMGGYAPNASVGDSSASPGPLGGSSGLLATPGSTLGGLPGAVRGEAGRSPGGIAADARNRRSPQELSVLTGRLELGGSPVGMLGGALRGGSRAAEPTKPVSRVLVGGTGARVRPGATVAVQYVGARRRDGVIFDSSYARGGPNAFVLRPGAVLPGWVPGLTGQRVGTRILLVVPEALEREFVATTGGVTAPDTTNVYLIDILGQYT